MRRVPVRAVIVACLLALSLTLFPLCPKADSTAPRASSNRFAWSGANQLGTFARIMIGGQAVCLEANAQQARSIKERDSSQSAQLPGSVKAAASQTGLTINLRSAPQLQNFPLALAAFKRAAARWEALIQTEAAIVIDVDFGPTLFGSRFDKNVVSITDAQAVRGNCLYPAIRAGLVSESSNGEESSLYDSLPAKSLPTDRGDSTAMVASSATLRALGLINQAADLAAESSYLGPPPAVGVNSKFDFDFNPDDGIDQGKLDFEAIASHEIGHALGFISSVGQQEADSSIETEPSICDLFRIRPDAIQGSFASAHRVLTSGGEQSFYASGSLLALSTGRPDGAGGDNRQAAHWKDDALTGRYIGIMDPTIGPGEHQAITENDTSALDAIGYTINNPDPLTVALISGQPELGGMTAPPQNLGVLSRTQYSIAVPQGATQLKIDLKGDQDVDLFARFGQRVLLQGHNPTTDYMSTTESSSESITVTQSSAPPLRSGIYYIAIANFGPGDASFTVTATVTGAGINNAAINRAPAIFNLKADLEGDALEVAYAASDCEGDFAIAEVSLLDESGRAIGPSSRFDINFGDASLIESQLAISGLGARPEALQARIILIDRSGNRSSEAVVDFSKTQAGALNVLEATFDKSGLILKVRGNLSGLELEINSHSVAPPRKIKIKKSGSKLQIKGDAGQLSLRQGPNRIRVKNESGWSNILILNL